MDDTLLTTDVDTLDTIPLEHLEAHITGMASRIAAATATWLLWIAAYDRRQGWAQWGTKSCAQWLNWHCGMSPRTAREHIAIGHKLEQFTELRDTFLAGALSYSKVRAIARVIEPENERDLIDLAKDATASQLDRTLAKVPTPDASDTDPKPADVTFTNNGDGTTTMTLTGPTADMAVAKKAVQLTSSRVIDREHQEGETKSQTIERLGGMNSIRTQTTLATLTGTTEPIRNTDTAVLVVADIEALNGSDTAAESTVENQRVHPETVRRLCCDSKIQTALVNGNGDELATGSEQRIVPRRIRRLLLRRDHGMCQFPGCESTHRLHAHHIIHWANGGPTELWNLISLCDYHHHNVHEGGWNIETTSNGFTFYDPNGTPHHVPVLRLPTRKPLPVSRALENGPAEPLAGTGERADIHFIADIITTNTQLRKDRPLRSEN